MDFEVIPNTKAVVDEFKAKGYGNNEIVLTRHELEYFLEALEGGAVIGLYDGEYTTTIRLKGENENE